MKTKPTPQTKPLFNDLLKRRYKIATYLFIICWMLVSLLLFVGSPNQVGNSKGFSYLSSMSGDIQWERVYTGSDLRATLLKNEIETIGVQVQVQSNKDAGLHAGFGPSGVSQVFVRAEDADKVVELVENFKEKME